jgi:hypothetical protein
MAKEAASDDIDGHLITAYSQPKSMPGSVIYLPLRASRRPSSVNAALRSSGLPPTPWRTTHPRSTARVARVGRLVSREKARDLGLRPNDIAPRRAHAARHRLGRRHFHWKKVAPHGSFMRGLTETPLFSGGEWELIGFGEPTVRQPTSL